MGRKKKTQIIKHTRQGRTAFVHDLIRSANSQMRKWQQEHPNEWIAPQGSWLWGTWEPDNSITGKWGKTVCNHVREIQKDLILGHAIVSPSNQVFFVGYELNQLIEDKFKKTTKRGLFVLFCADRDMMLYVHSASSAFLPF